MRGAPSFTNAGHHCRRGAGLLDLGSRGWINIQHAVTMVADPMRAIEPFYYLDNFRSMLETLKRRDGDLLTPEESSFICEFYRLPQRSSALLVRMVMRKGPLFRAARLVYPEIGDIEEAVRPLTGLQWVDARPALTLQYLFALYRKAEVAHCLRLPKHCVRLPKWTLLAGLLDPA